MAKPPINISQISGPSIVFEHAGQELRAGCLTLPLGSEPAIIGINSNNCRSMGWDEFVSLGRAMEFNVPNEQKYPKVIGMIIKADALTERLLVPIPCTNVKMIAVPRIPILAVMTITIVVIEVQP